MEPANRSLRILLADDEVSIRLLLTRILEHRGHSIVSAASAPEAMARAAEEPFDVAVLDVRMPGSGLVVARSLAKHHGLAGRIVLMTGDEAASVEGLVEGTTVLTKPIAYEAAIDLIETLAAR